jgi:hypothetical protein
MILAVFLNASFIVFLGVFHSRQIIRTSIVLNDIQTLALLETDFHHNSVLSQRNITKTVKIN